MLLHVDGTQSLRLIDERALLVLVQRLPLGAQSLADLAVVHLWVLLRHFAPLPTTPHHECVHRPLYTVHVLIAAVAVVVIVGVMAIAGTIAMAAIMVVGSGHSCCNSVRVAAVVVAGGVDAG